MDGSSNGMDRASALLRKFDDARFVVTAVLGEILAERIATPAELVDAIGAEALDRYLPAEVRVRLLRAAIVAGRRGTPFSDVTLLNVATPDVVARSLPLDLLRTVVEALCKPKEKLDELGDDDLAPVSASLSLDETLDLPGDAVELLPPSQDEPKALSKGRRFPARAAA